MVTLTAVPTNILPWCFKCRGQSLRLWHCHTAPDGFALALARVVSVLMISCSILYGQLKVIALTQNFNFLWLPFAFLKCLLQICIALYAFIRVWHSTVILLFRLYVKLELDFRKKMCKISRECKLVILSFLDICMQSYAEWIKTFISVYRSWSCVKRGLKVA